MDEIDKELRKIQLQRERLALEREIALKEATSAIGSITNGVKEATKSGGQFLVLWWKKILSVAILLVIVSYAVNSMHEHEQNQKMLAMNAKMALLDAASNAFAHEKCPEHKFQCDAVESKKSETCYKKANDIFERSNCRFVGCNQSQWDIERNSCIAIQKIYYKQANPFKED